jgi:two-component system chemotaxis sensor kinase CheA
MTTANNDILNIFWEEVSDHLNVLNESLLRVEMATGNDRILLLKEMNRVAHSMKGAARAVGFTLVENVAHYMEEIFYLSLEKGMVVTPAIADTMYDGLDLIQNVMANQANDDEVIVQVIVNMQRAIEGFVPEPQETGVWSPQLIPTKKSTMDGIPIINFQADANGNSTNGDSSSNDFVPFSPQISRSIEETIRVSIGKLDELMAEVSELSVVKMRGDIRYGRMTDLRKLLSRWQREWRSVRTAYIRLVRRLQDEQQTPTPELLTLLKFLETNQRYINESNRDMTQVHTMLAQDQLTLSTLTDQLQDHVADLRMMPFETVSGGFQRMVRDLARDLQKQVVLDILGTHVEIDKAVLDALKEPLMHLLRNSLDHGLESPEERERVGKPVFGLIELIVEQRGSEIFMQVGDDGRGIDVQRVRKKAVEKGLLNQAQAEALDDDSARMLIFQAGFSTTDSVTSISGRGLGMDIVRERVEGLRGRISLSSVMGKGTTTTINVPVSLTRIRCILLRVGEEEYAIPSVMISRMEKVRRADMYTAKGQNMVMMNNRPVTLASLSDVLGVPTISPTREQIDVIILQALDRFVAFEVDDLYSELELVLKPLGRELANSPFVAGASLLGSGDVVIVLDANDLVRAASGDSMPVRNRQTVLSSEPIRRRLRVLVVDDSITTRTLEKNILEAVGFEVFVAVDGMEAWAQLAEIMPDVIISDVEMPQMNGLELARRVKSDPRTHDIPLILLTSLNKPEQREAGLTAGADAYLVKSRFDQNELLATIQSVI